MGTLSIRDDLLERLERLASQQQRPVDQEAERLLTESIERHEARRQARNLLEDVAEMTPRGVPQTDAVDLLREDRGR